MKTGRKIPWAALPGLLLILFGLIGLYRVPKISQYVYLPGKTEDAQVLAAAEEKWDGAFDAVSLHGTAEQTSLTAGSRSRGEVTLYEILGGYFEVYPRRFTAGRPLSRGDAGHAVIVLDEQLAFELFGAGDPLAREVRIGEARFEVVGVAAHMDRIGETGKYAAWIPLGAKDAPACGVMTISAVGGDGDSMRTVFESGASEAAGSGQTVFTGKERTRGTVMLRTVLFIVGFWLIIAWWRAARRLIRTWIGELREKSKSRYLRQMIGSVLIRALGILLLTALTVGAAAGLIVWMANLMQVFPEWVPESLVSGEAIAQRFRELTSAAARAVQFRTPELAEIRFWSGMIRWGIVLALLGCFHAARVAKRKAE